MNFVIFIIISFWITQTISNEAIFSFLRNFLNKKVKVLGKLISCPYCLGTWVGFGLSFLIVPLHTEYFFLDIILGGAISYTVQKLFGIIDNNMYLK